MALRVTGEPHGCHLSLTLLWSNPDLTAVRCLQCRPRPLTRGFGSARPSSSRSIALMPPPRGFIAFYPLENESCPAVIWLPKLRWGGRGSNPRATDYPRERVREYPRANCKATPTNTFKPWTFGGIRERLARLGTASGQQAGSSLSDH